MDKTSVSSFHGYIFPYVEYSPSGKKLKKSHCGHLYKVGDYHLAICGREIHSPVKPIGIQVEGRLFNKERLSALLDAGTLDETELLISAYRKWGISFPRYIEGDFAFVLWDCTVGRVIIGCGTEGNLPFFYTQHAKSLYFARELRSLLIEMPTLPRINENYLAQWLSITFAGSKSTFFENVFRLVPGTVMVYEQGRITLNDYWQPENTPMLYLKDSREYADGLREVLTQAVSLRLPGHSVGSMLSGGLDSSSVTSIAAELLQKENRRLYAFTAVPQYPVNDFSGRFCDEGPAAASVAAMRPNIDHVLVRHGKHSVFSMMDMFGARQLEPIFNPSNYDWIYEISLQAQHRELDTILTGTSGNISISYDGRFALPTLASSGRFGALLKLASTMHSKNGNSWSGIAYTTLSPWIPLGIDRFINKNRQNNVHLLEYSLINPEFAARHNMEATPFKIKNDFRTKRIQHLRRSEIGAANDIFRKITGIQRLDPTTDRRVAEYCLSVPIEHYIERGVPRSLIRNAMLGRLPEQVRTERRKGLQAADFALHFEKERNEALMELARMKKVDIVAKTLDLEKMEQMMHWSEEQITAHGGRLGYWPKLMRAFSVGRFLRRFEDGTLFKPLETQN